MKVCSACYRLYPPDAGFCPIDGKPLMATSEVPLPRDLEDARIGSTVCAGRYQIWRKVADGGMGRVYQAVDKKATNDQSVAVKVLHSEVAEDAVAVERFKREYALSAELPHEYIVEVLDFQKTEDQSYALVMEYLEGEELRMLLQREKKLSAARLIRVVSQLALGLEQPHKLKLVHRDIKPDNIFLVGTPDGPRVKLLDFGSVRDNSEGAKKLTVVGTTIGSPFYMSPEQAQGASDLDHRADVWSIAAIAYECLTEKVPFYGATGPAILLAILGKEPDPPSVTGKQNQVPATLDDVMMEALSKNVATRIKNVGDLADRIGQAYGLDGTHREWAHITERELKTRIQERLPALLAAPSHAAMDTAMRAAQPAAQPPAAFSEDLIMGVPQGPPKSLYIGLALTGLLLVVGIAAYVLL